VWTIFAPTLGVSLDPIHTLMMSAATLTATFSFEASNFKAATVAARRVGFIFGNPKFDLSNNSRQQPRKRKPFRKPQWLK
jgi:hypothetical protein